MAMGLSQELIVAIKADISNFLTNLKKAEAELGGFAKKAVNPFSELKKGFAQADRYAGVFGNSMGATKEKMALLERQIRSFTDKGLTANSNAVKVLKNQYDALAKSGGKGMQLGRIADMLTGGKMSQATQMLGAMGVNMGAVAAVAGPVALGIAAVAAVWKGAIAPGIAFNAMLEQQEVGFRVMLGSAQKASQMMADLRELTLTTPIGFAEGAQGAKQLMAYGFGQNEIIKNMKLIGTLASATGSNVSELVYVYGTLRAQGQAYTRDLMQFGMRGIPIYEYLAKSLGVSVREIKKLTESGKIGYNEVRVALEAMTGEGGRFNNMLEEQMKTLKGQQTVLKNTFDLVRGEMASSWESVAKGYTAATIPMVKAMGSIMTPLTDTLSMLAKILKPVYDFLVIVVQYWAIIIESIKAAFRLLGNLLKPITDIVGGFFKWLDPLGRVMKFLDGVLKKIKAVGKATSEAPVEYATDFSFWPSNQMVRSESERIVDGLYDAVAKRRVTSMEQLISPTAIAEWQKTYNDMNAGAAYSYEEALNSVLSVAYSRYGVRISKEMYDSLLEGATEYATDFWSIFMRSAPEKTFTGLEAFYTYGKEAATAYAKQWDEKIGEIRRGIGDIFTADAGKAEIESIAKSGLSVLRDALTNFESTAGDPKKYTGQQLIFWNTLIAKINEYAALVGETGIVPDGAVEAAKESSEYLAEYLKFRADAMNIESAQLQLQLMFLTGNGDLLELQETQYGVVEMVNDEYRRQWVLLKYNYDQEVEAVNEEYKKLEINGVLSDALKIERDLRLKLLGIMLEENDAQLKLKVGQELYNKQLEGSKKYWEELQSAMGYAAERGDYASYTGMAAINATQGTEAGSLISGGDVDIWTMIINAIMKAVAGLENFQKVLNFITYMAEIIVAPLNDAIEPLVLLLDQAAAIISMVFTPVISEMAIWIEDIVAILIPFFDIIAVAVKVLMPLVMKLLNIVTFIFDGIRGMIGLNEEEMAIRQAQLDALKKTYDKEIQSLQDLYQVGAISGKEYERLLAEMRAGYDASALLDPAGELVGGGLGEVLNGILAALVSLVNAVLNILIPLIQIITDLFGGAFLSMLQAVIDIVRVTADILAPIVQFVADIVQLIADIFVPLVNLLMGKLTWADAMGVMAAGWNTFVEGFKGFVNALIGGWNWLVPAKYEIAPWLATGTSNLPNDMLAQVHQGEMVVPKTFADSIRSGEVTLGGPKGTNTGTTIVNNYYVEGSVISERELYKKTGANMTKLRKMGYA